MKIIGFVRESKLNVIHIRGGAGSVIEEGVNQGSSVDVKQNGSQD